MTKHPPGRREDQRLVTGEARFVEDLLGPGFLHASFVRSPHTRATIVSVDTSAAARMSGVRQVLTAETLRTLGIGKLPIDVPLPGQPAGAERPAAYRQTVLADGRIEFSGEAVACVVADTREAAKDAAEAVLIEYLPDASAVNYPHGNHSFFTFGNGDREAVEHAFAHARRVVTLDVVNGRIAGMAMETRGCIAEWEAETGYLLRTGTQRPHNMQHALADSILGEPRERVRVVIGDVGGGFGTKNGIYPEYVVCLAAARLLKRPVSWIAERGEDFLTSNHGRDNLFRIEAALDGKGLVAALAARRHINFGAYVAPRGMVPAANGLTHLTGVYRIPSAYVAVEGHRTNTVPTASYRGAGRPESVHCCERFIDFVAREQGEDPFAFRRRMIAPPGAGGTALGSDYGAADFSALLDQAEAMADRKGFPGRRDESEACGFRRGLGVALIVEDLHGSPSPAPARLRLRDGRLHLFSGTASAGQGHETAFLQIISERLGIPPESLGFIQGDTASVPDGIGSAASWSATLAGSSTHLVAMEAIVAGKRVAARLFEAAEADIAFAEGRFLVAGTDRVCGWRQIFAAEPDFAADAVFHDHGCNAPAGCHVCEVEVDPETGSVSMERYVLVQETGRVINAQIVHGQLHGGLAQGIGQGWMEEIRYDADSGQLLTGSLMDYAVPRAADLPAFEIHLETTPDPGNPLGVKGIGEAGATGGTPAFVNAVVDALWPLGVKHIDMPLTPYRVWQAIQGAAARQRRM